MRKGKKGNANISIRGIDSFWPFVVSNLKTRAISSVG
jgi:hypothetical protein